LSSKTVIPPEAIEVIEGILDSGYEAVVKRERGEVVVVETIRKVKYKGVKRDA
jgi:hypothetical protein